jgi:quinol monooxygenase YgiN
VAEHAAVINVSRYRPASGKRDELLKAMARMAERASSAPGCFGAQACVSDRDHETLIAISRWESRPALDAFAGTAASTTEREHLEGLLGGSAQRENLTPV